MESTHTSSARSSLGASSSQSSLGASSSQSSLGAGVDRVESKLLPRLRVAPIKRKRTDNDYNRVSPVEDRHDNAQVQSNNIVFSRFGHIRVTREFNYDIDRMISDHIHDTRTAFDSVIGSFDFMNTMEESVPTSLDVDARHDLLLDRLRIASRMILDRFMTEVEGFISDIFVHNEDGSVRAINTEEIRFFLRNFYLEMSALHSDIFNLS